MLVENIQRRDLDPHDEQSFFRALKAEYGYTYRQIADLIHKSAMYVSRRMNDQLLDLQSSPESELDVADQATLVVDESCNAPLQETSQDESCNAPLQEQAIKPAGKRSLPVPKPRYNPAAFQRFSVTLESALLYLGWEEKPPDEETKTRIRQDVSALKRKLAEIERHLEQEAVPVVKEAEPHQD
jgi:transcriptional regulator with XRE-family HTH domain